MQQGVTDMSTQTEVIWSTAVLLLTLSLPGCSLTTAQAERTSHASPNDLLFITTLYNIVEFDKDVIKPEIAGNSDPRVAELGQDLLAQALSFESRVLPIAERDGISQPQLATIVRRSDLHDRIAALVGSRDYDYDQEFLNDEISAHQQAIRRSKQMSEDPSGDPELRKLASQGIGLLQTNLDRLEHLQTTLLAEKR
jgi:predicted outer membrane protein